MGYSSDRSTRMAMYSLRVTLDSCGAKRRVVRFFVTTACVFAAVFHVPELWGRYWRRDMVDVDDGERMGMVEGDGWRKVDN